MDVDIVADLQPEHAPVLTNALRDQFYVPDDTSLRRVIEQRASFNLIHLATMFKVDIFLPRSQDFDRQQLKRRIAEPVAEKSDEYVWVLSPEDVVLAKLDWFRMGGEVSERQWRDVLGVLQTQLSVLDVDYMRLWAQELQVGELFERALAETTG
jgi:hypothetical protein